MSNHKDKPNDEIDQTITKHSPSYKLYFALILLLDQLKYAIPNFQPSSSSWVNIVFNPKVLQSICK
jgi:hypothetical protein